MAFGTVGGKLFHSATADIVHTATDEPELPDVTVCATVHVWQDRVGIAAAVAYIYIRILLWRTSALQW